MAENSREVKSTTLATVYLSPTPNCEIHKTDTKDDSNRAWKKSEHKAPWLSDNSSRKQKQPYDSQPNQSLVSI